MALALRTPSPLSQTINEGNSTSKGSEDKIFSYINDIKWKDSVKEAFLTVLDYFGLPSAIAPQACGSAKWRFTEGPLSSVEVKDECVVSKRSSEYAKTCVYVTVLYDLKRSKCTDKVSEVSPAVLYDYEKKALTARAESFSACIAILMVATNIANCYPGADTEKILREKVVEKAIEMAKDEDQLKVFTEQLAVNLRYAPGSTIVREIEQ
jgi:hypothetical protein